MCKLCCNLRTLKEKIKGNNSGFPVGESEAINIWEDENPIESIIWYDTEGIIKNRKFILELSIDNDRLIYPIKYCPKCGRRLEVM